MKKYYKLYNLIDSKLFSSLDKKNNIELNKKYNAKYLGFNLCFADINIILNYKDEHGYVVCDVEPVGKVNESAHEADCESIIVRNPRSIYSPEFINELIMSGGQNAWDIVSDYSFVSETIKHSNDGMCYDIDLSYKGSDALKLLLLDIYDNEKINEYFERRRKDYYYKNMLEYVKGDRDSMQIVIDTWNKNNPSVKSKLLKLFSFITSLF